jgi:hypothetical protein
VNPEEPASGWIESFRYALPVNASELVAPVERPIEAVEGGRLKLERSGEAEFEIKLAASLIDSANMGKNCDREVCGFQSPNWQPTFLPFSGVTRSHVDAPRIALRNYSKYEAIRPLFSIYRCRQILDETR